MRNLAKKFAKERGQLVSTILNGEFGSVDMEKTNAGIEALRGTMLECKDKNTCNMDETGLFHHLLRGLKKKARGKKGMNAKDCISLCVCTNMTGTEKVPLAVTRKVPKSALLWEEEKFLCPTSVRTRPGRTPRFTGSGSRRFSYLTS